MLKIATKDGKSVEVTQDIRGMSKLVEQALMDNQEEMVDLPLAEVNEKELNLVVEFCQHHNWNKTDSGIKCPLPKKTLEGNITDEWDRNFVTRFDRDGQTDLLMAANAMEIDALFELCCAALATEFKYAEWDKLKADFGLQDLDYKPDEADGLMNQYKWIVGDAEAKVLALIKEQHAQGKTLEN